MLELEVVLILLMPLAPLTALCTVSSNARRRSWLMAFVFSVFVVFLWYSLLNWVLHDLRVSLFDTPVAPAMRYFFSGTKTIIAYLLIVSVAGYIADLSARRSIERNG